MTQAGDAKLLFLELCKNRTLDEEVAILLPKLGNFPAGGVGRGEAQADLLHISEGSCHVVDGHRFVCEARAPPISRPLTSSATAITAAPMPISSPFLLPFPVVWVL